MKIYEVTRRGFLKGLAGAAATAATPGGVADLAKTIAEPAAVAVEPVVAGVADMLFNTAMKVGSNMGFVKSDSMWDDEEGSEEDSWDKDLEQEQGEYGEMPWGEYYEMGESPGGVPYLHTSDSPDGNYGVFTFIDDGKPQYIVIAWERGGFGELDSASDPKYMKRYYNGSSDWEGEPSEMIDIVMNPENDAVPSDADTQSDDADEKTDTSAADISRLSRLAGIAKSGHEKLSKFGHQQQPEQPAHMGDEPKQLPAPSGDNTFDFDLNKEKVPVKRTGK